MHINADKLALEHYIIQICSGITSGRVLDGELLYTKILEVNLFAFVYRLFHEDFSPINGVFWNIMYVFHINNIPLYFQKTINP